MHRKKGDKTTLPAIDPMEAANAGVHVLRGCVLVVVARCRARRFGLVVLGSRARVDGLTCTVARTLAPAGKGARLVIVLFFNVVFNVEFCSLYHVFQEHDGGVCHARLQLPVDNPQDFPRRDSLVHHATRVAAKYALATEPLHAGFKHLQIAWGDPCV